MLDGFATGFLGFVVEEVLVDGSSEILGAPGIPPDMLAPLESVPVDVVDGVVELVVEDTDVDGCVV